MIGEFLGAQISKVLTPNGWDRIRHDGTTVSLHGGIPAVAGSLLAARSTPGFIAVAASALAGYIDDHHESDSSVKGLSGHLNKLRDGEVTTGVVKIGLIGGGALLASLKNRNPIVSTIVIAGSANLINLLDLRPGRALKASASLATIAGLTSPFSTSSQVAGGALGTIAACWDSDIEGSTMLGDMGANALGALVGVSLANHRIAAVPKIAAVGIVGLILASEKVSFSSVIESNELLKHIDRYGRE